ncbi:MAG: hypothetical protein HWN66_06395 [Candidatus Helarchaeota archaeon]|nr:hypothetical protein [Candidatus Helarchaeota archaeon]
MLKISQNILENSLLRIIIADHHDSTSERIEIHDNGNWIPFLSSLSGFSTLLFYKGKEFDSISLSFKTKTKNTLVFQSSDAKLTVNLEIKLVDRDLIHFKYDLVTKAKLKLSKLIANYSILLGSEPSYKWVPHIRPKENYVMGDHVFRSPAIIYNKGQISFALIPDLDLLKENRPFQTLMDFNLKNEETGGDPRIYYGFGNYKPAEHIFFKHNPKKKMKIKKGTNLSFGYYIKIFKETPVSAVLESINSFLWRTYGQKLLYENLNPQILPYKINVEEGFKAIFDRQKSWVDFKIDEADCGGVFQSSWIGKRKKKYKFITPEDAAEHKTGNFGQRIDQDSLLGRIIMHFSNSLFWIKRFAWFTSHFPVINRVAEIWYNAWFMNIRTGYGFRYFGEIWNDKDLVDKGNKIFNTLLNLPSIRGVFPTVIFPASFDATEFCTINGLKAFIYTDDFNIIDVSLAMYWGLKFHQDLENRPEIKEKCADLLDLLEEIQLENGAIPVFINFKEDNHTPIISDVLIDSASSGAPLMFLTEYYKISQDSRIIPIAQKIAKYLQTEIIPVNKWHDFEPFFSCTNFPFDLFDDYTQSHVMNALCIYWAAEGLKELYSITKNDTYLQSGEQVMSILNLFQQVWDLPYISFNTYGGFCSQNADAELSDARQGLFVRVYMEYYLLTGKKEYMERAIATLRACWAVQLLSEYEEQCSGNLKGIGTIDGVDRGCVFENYGHSGNDFPVLGYIFLDWGIGTSASATAYVKKHFGDLYIDFKEQIAWGIDGLTVQSTEFTENRVDLTIDKLPEKNSVLLKARAIPQPQIEIIINNSSLGLMDKDTLEAGFKISF